MKSKMKTLFSLTTSTAKNPEQFILWYTTHHNKWRTQQTITESYSKGMNYLCSFICVVMWLWIIIHQYAWSNEVVILFILIHIMLRCACNYMPWLEARETPISRKEVWIMMRGTDISARAEFMCNDSFAFTYILHACSTLLSTILC